MASAKTTKNNVTKLAKTTDISAQLEALREDMALLAAAVKVQTKSAVSERASAVKDVVSEKASTIKTAASETTETAKVKYDEVTTKAETTIRENPLTSVAIAVGAGLLLGALTRK